MTVVIGAGYLFRQPVLLPPFPERKALDVYAERKKSDQSGELRPTDAKPGIGA